jgi:hypothetical protein
MVYIAPRIPGSIIAASSSSAIKKLANVDDLVSTQSKYSFLGLRDRLIKSFRDQGLTAQDLPTAIIIHEALGIFMLALTWSLCYFVQISTLPMLKEPLARIAAMMPKVISTNEILNSRLGVAYCESSCLRKLIRPFTLPAKIIITVKLVQWIHTLQHRYPSLSSTTGITDSSRPSKDGAETKSASGKIVAWNLEQDDRMTTSMGRRPQDFPREVFSIVF